jgi:hypothetical protein
MKPTGPPTPLLLPPPLGPAVTVRRRKVAVKPRVTSLAECKARDELTLEKTLAHGVR